MDPNATLARIAALLRQSAHDDDAGEQLDVVCQDLYDWFTRGGFDPTNKCEHPSAWEYYKCREVQHRRGERV